jgi:hypothetical protein
LQFSQSAIFETGHLGKSSTKMVYAARQCAGPVGRQEPPQNLVGNVEISESDLQKFRQTFSNLGAMFSGRRKSVNRVGDPASASIGLTRVPAVS